MPLQLIHTSAPHLLDSNSAGYGTVARSEKLPRALCAQLTALSILREPKGGSATTGPQYSYSIIEHAGNPWHVLTCTQSAGADYSGRICHISHHLILSLEEVRILHSHSLRPTPAGFMLALRNNGFWKSKWEGEPQYLTDGPTFSSGDMPDAEAQPTWKQHTGHKSNARAFFTPPYDRDCLITVPKGTPAAEVLQLFHESDWLTHTRGWGITFTTEADESDSHAETLRIVTGAGSPLVQRAQRTGHPVLNIEQGMELPLSAPALEPAPGNPAQKDGRQPPHGGMMRTLSRTVNHYHYIEEPDWLMYDVRPSRARWPYAASGVLVLSALCLAAWIFHTPAGYSTDEDVAVDAQPQHSISIDHMQMLSRLAASPYQHEHTVRILAELAGITETAPEDTLIQEAVSLLRSAAQPGTRHALAMKRLCECARLMGLKDRELALLYLNEALHSTTPDEWQKQFNGQHVTDWLALKQSEPQILTLLEEEEFRAYAPRHEAPETTILATADTAAPAAVDEAATPPPIPSRISLIPGAAVSGSPLPAELETAITRLPLSISTGSYVISCFAEGGELRSPQRLELSPNGYRLYITPTENPGEFALVPEHTEGKPSPVPSCTFKVQKGKLQNIRCDGKKAVVSFPIATGKDFLTNIILASSFGIPLPPTEKITLPPASEADLDISPDSLEIDAASINSGSPRLSLIKTRKFPWVISRKEEVKNRFTINLPVLIGHNAIQKTGDELPSYKLTSAEVVSETADLTSLRCEVIHSTRLPERLKNTFDLVANSPCCGETRNNKNKSLTLANLYYICCALANPKLSIKQKKQLQQEYFSLFASKQFNKILLRVLEKETVLHITPQEAASSHLKALQVRNNIKKMLNERSVRDLIRKRICEVLTRSLYAAYTLEQNTLNSEASTPPVLILRNISVGEHVELLWQFQMQEKL